MDLEVGMLARAKAGHDKDCIYVIISVNDEYVYLADGRLRSVCRPKKKNRKHVQPIACVHCGSVTDDAVIRKTVREFLKENNHKSAKEHRRI